MLVDVEGVRRAGQVEPADGAEGRRTVFVSCRHREQLVRQLTLSHLLTGDLFKSPPKMGLPYVGGGGSERKGLAMTFRFIFFLHLPLDCSIFKF